MKFETVSRTETADRLVDEMIISFTHTIEMDHILPGVKPTGKFAEVTFVVIVIASAKTLANAILCGNMCYIVASMTIRSSEKATNIMKRKVYIL